MSKRQRLTFIISFMTMLGLATSVYPFIKSLNPSAKAVADWPRIDISDMQPGTYKIVLHPHPVESFRGTTLVVLVVRKINGQFHAWYFISRNGAVLVPDPHWWTAYFACQDFGPTLRNGVIDETKPIQCHDNLPPIQSWLNAYKWSIDGKAFTSNVADLTPIPEQVDGNYLVLLPFY